VEKISIIIPTWNQARSARPALESAEGAIGYLKRQPDGHDVEVEVIVIDDGSEDGTRAILEDFTRGRPGHQLLLRSQATNLACARNRGVTLSSGDPIFFLDPDDHFFENHLHECIKVFKGHDEVDFVKTPIVLSDPVHPDWVARITNSLVTNLGVRRRCHELVGGFPDIHLLRRVGDRFEHAVDLFRGIEDVFYNKKVAALARGRALSVQTVLHARHPGNAFDRQYERFQHPPGQGRAEVDDLYNMRVEVAKIVTDHDIAAIQRRQGAAVHRP
jgi:glycosyltransferase involved in cell wall biosynthesis